MPSGFGVWVKALVDKGSFQDGINEIQKLGAASKKVIAGITGIAAAAVSSAAIAGEVAQQELKVASAIGVSSEALSSWKVAANVAGASASGLIGQLMSLETKMQHLKTGTVDMNLAKNLGLMGIGYGDFSKMDSETRMKTVFNQANQMEDQELAATLIGDILGQAGADYYNSLKMSGKSIEQQLAEAKKLNFVSNQNRKEAALFASEVKSIKEAGKSITMLFGSEMARVLMPTVKQIKNYLINNREQIRKGVQGFVQNIGAVFKIIAGVIEKVAPIVTGLIDKFGGLDQIIIKVGVGFASMKLVQFAGGIMSIVRSVNLLKAGLTGIAAGGLFLIIDDIIGHFQGKTSYLFDMLPEDLKMIKEAFNLDFDFTTIADSVKTLTQNFIELIKQLTGSKTASEALGKSFKLTLTIVDGLISAIGALLVTLTALPNLQKYAFGDSKEKAEAGKALSANYDYFKQNKVTAPLVGFVEGIQEWQSLRNIRAQVLKDIKGEYDAFNISKKTKGQKLSKDDLSPGQLAWIDQYFRAGGSREDIGKYVSGYDLQDGIISPGGRITSVSPDDWVFAVKNVADLAGGLLPPSVTNSSTTSESVSYTINQNLSVGSGAKSLEVKQMAYRGTSEALQENIRNASRRMQMLPATR